MTSSFFCSWQPSITSDDSPSRISTTGSSPRLSERFSRLAGKNLHKKGGFVPIRVPPENLKKKLLFTQAGGVSVTTICNSREILTNPCRRAILAVRRSVFASAQIL
jgi:hypothetical protein